MIGHISQGFHNGKQFTALVVNGTGVDG